MNVVLPVPFSPVMAKVRCYVVAAVALVDALFCRGFFVVMLVTLSVVVLSMVSVDLSSTGWNIVLTSRHHQHALNADSVSNTGELSRAQHTWA